MRAVKPASRRRAGRFQRSALLVAITMALLGTAACTAVANAQDREPPDLTLPETLTVRAPDMDGVEVALNTTVRDVYDSAPVTVCDAPEGKYPIGTTTVTCTATDKNGNSVTQSVDVTVSPPNGDRVVQVVAGDTRCARYEGGTIRCWGDGHYGQFGNGGFENEDLPVEIPGISDAIDMALFEGQVCALREDHTVWCWGQNIQQSDGGYIERLPVPTQVPDLIDVEDISDGCALIAGGTVRCWRDRKFSPTHTDVPIAGITNAVSVGTRCAVLADATVSCWGSNTNGQLGTGQPLWDWSDEAVPIVGLTDVAEVDGNYATNCARRTTGELLCWGYGGEGQRGDGTILKVRRTPEPVVGLTGVSDISLDGTGNQVACATTDDGKGWCWGDNYGGQLGTGWPSFLSPPPPPAIVDPFDPNGWHVPYPWRSTIPAPVMGIDSATQISSSAYGGCALLSDDTVRCWGQYSVGDGSSFEALAPITVGGLD